MKLVTIYWARRTTHDQEMKIRKRFGITAGTTINGETPAKISDTDMPLLEETARRGFIQIRPYREKLKHLIKETEK